jgi:hypothetical protein
LLEVMVSTLIFGTVSVAVMAAFAFLGTSLTRLVHAQQLEQNSRRAFYLFNQDVGMATMVSTASDATLALTLPATTVTYAYDSSARTVTRTSGGTSSVVLKNLTAFDFNYFNKAGTQVSVNIKGVQFSFTASLGTEIGGVAGTAVYRTASRFQTVSPIVFMRNTAPNSLLPP